MHKILLFNLNDESQAGMIEQKTYELLATVPGAQNVMFRHAIPEGEVRYQYLISVDFDSMSDHAAYLVHELHVTFSQQIFRPNVSDLLIQFFE